MSYKCKHCMNSQRVTIEGVEMWYCNKNHRYCPSPAFINAWGCDNYEDRQLTLFNEERRTKDDNTHNS